MPKSRIMGAGLASSTNTGSRANVRQIQFGDKLQGLPPTRNKRVEFALRNIQKRSYGENRNHVFCMNQIGGIGAVGSGNRSRMFATTADGVKDCVPTKKTNSLVETSTPGVLGSIPGVLGSSGGKWQWIAGSYTDAYGLDFRINADGSLEGACCVDYVFLDGKSLDDEGVTLSAGDFVYDDNFGECEFDAQGGGGCYFNRKITGIRDEYGDSHEIYFNSNRQPNW